MKYVAKRPLTYRGQRVEVGDEFEPSRQDGRLFQALGHADLVTDESEPDEKPKAKKKAKKRAYKRRDMKAED